MSLSSSLFSGISGLSTLGNAMQIIGDNIANVNTIGFKGSSFTFQDLLSQSVATLSGTSQVGRGTALGDITSTFQQGSFESTGNTTDLAIGGAGFFVLKEAGTLNNFYSRAGNFTFDQNGYLTNPEGYIVQGWELDANGNDAGSIGDIAMSSFTSPPSATDNIEVIVNLNSDGSDNTSGADDSLAVEWDATKITPIDEDAYEYLTSLRAYDSLGSTHDITLYFDKADTSSAYEFIVTCNPSEAFRDDGTGTHLAGSANSWTGLLARGMVAFDSSGSMID
ncbi:MAG: flagellar hook-basal body complex protein, partial [Deltaproteobacteria bacterium]|nr:flagellar hook-basal body complex protein [Deltaproteobacteria bacterium]